MPTYASSKTREHKCMGFSEALEQKRQQQQERNKPQPWIARKLTVGIVLALIGYAYYVYVVRFCIVMLRGESRALGTKTTGIALTAVFNILFLIFLWAYGKVVLTSPGYAADYVPKTPPPLPQPQPEGQTLTWQSDDGSIAGTPYHTSFPPSRNHSRPSVDIPSFTDGNTSPRPPRPSHSRHNTHDSALNMTQTRYEGHQRTDSLEARPLDGIPAMASVRSAANAPQHPPPMNTNPELHPPRNGGDGDASLPPPLFSRRPPTHPTLSPEYRYCSRDGFVKPMRTHHCRACGTCVLKYDHHCPWIGQCVGAFNHKFFVNFLQWSTIFTTFILSSLIGLNVKASISKIMPSIDPQHIVIIALSGLFTFFTATLLITQINLVVLNATTVEHLGMQRMRDRERDVLARMTGFPCPCCVEDDPDVPEKLGGKSPFQACISRQRIKEQWDEEWGKIDTEGNIWWLGSKRANWEATMGRSKLGWILPIGRSLGNGLTYPTNPRFDRDGRWRRRSEWPDGLR